jgi:hypothetical protein
MRVELDIPKKYEKEIVELAKKIDWEKLLKRALISGLERELELEFAFRKAEKIVKKSKLTERKIRELSEEIKERVVRKLKLI